MQIFGANPVINQVSTITIKYRTCKRNQITANESNDLIYSDLKGFGCLLGQSTLKHLTSLR